MTMQVATQAIGRGALCYVAVSMALAALAGDAAGQTNGAANSSSGIPGGLIAGGAPGPVGNVGAEYKFDDGFYQKIQNLILEEPQEGDFGVYDGTRYYSVVTVVSRDNGDGGDPEAAAEENKASLVRRLEALGARDIAAAGSLSFVTASIPVADVPGLSLRGEVFKMGDGELIATNAVDAARQVIHATPSDLRQSVARVPDGSGVVVSVIDSGINHNTAFAGRVEGRVLCGNSGCDPAAPSDVVVTYPGFGPNVVTSHGTRVADVVGASGLPRHNGIAPGVTFLDAAFGRELYSNGAPRYVGATITTMVHAIDWSLRNGADVINMSFSFTGCSGSVVTDVINIIINESVDKGMVAIASAANDGRDRDTGAPLYGSIGRPACAHNAIAVGGIDARSPNAIAMYTGSSRGPTGSSNVLGPDIVAPAASLQILTRTASTSTESSWGTSYAAPQASAVAAMMLQVDPSLTPAEVKAALLLGAEWRGPVPCTSSQYEANNAGDNCSYARQPGSRTDANNAASLGILNNVGLGILDAAKSLGYVDAGASHVVSGHLDPNATSRQYQFTVASTSAPVKVILTWLAHPHGGITEQQGRSAAAVPVADLGFEITRQNTTVASAESSHQNVEFAVFRPPSAGTYTVTVSGTGLDAINKPVQAFALASTASLSPSPPAANSPPVAHHHTAVFRPGEAKVIRLAAIDSDGDAVSFHVSRDPINGAVSTDELVAVGSSRVIYTPDLGFSGTDTFEVTPHDGTVSGAPAIITVVAESLPGGSFDAPPRSSDARDWDALAAAPGPRFAAHSEGFEGPGFEVSAVHVGAPGVEDASLSIAGGDGAAYTVSIPSSGERTIEFSAPVDIASARLSAGGTADEAAAGARVYVGYVPVTCTPFGEDAHPPARCPAASSYSALIHQEISIPDNGRALTSTSAVHVPVHGTVSSASVSLDVRHAREGDLRVALVPPGGQEITLYGGGQSRAGGINGTYASVPALANLSGSDPAGTWELRAGDYRDGVEGTLDSWSLHIEYEPAPAALSEGFEQGLGAWENAGGSAWEARAPSPPVPGAGAGNLAARSSGCVGTCVLETSLPLDLSAYPSAVLALDRYMSGALDAGEYLRVETHDGRSWADAFHWKASSGHDDGAWHSEVYAIPSGRLTSETTVRITALSNDSDEVVMVDNVRMLAALAPPSVGGIPDITMSEIDVRNVTAIATDPNGDVESVTFAGYPRFADVTLSSPGATTLSIRPAYGSAGVYTITAVARDASGFVDRERFTLNVTDAYPPPIRAPPDVEIESAVPVNVPIGWPSVSDTIDAMPHISNNAPKIFPFGNTTVTWTATWTATDSFNNSAYATQIVTVNHPLLKHLQIDHEYDGFVHIPFQDNTQNATSVINVPLDKNITSISVDVHVVHNWIGDMKMTLTSPSGTDVLLHDGGRGDLFKLIMTRTLDSTPGLSAFLGSPSAGDWTLSIWDYALGAGITILDWYLHLTYDAPDGAIPILVDYEPGTGMWDASNDLSWIMYNGSGTLPVGPYGTVPAAPVLSVNHCSVSCTMTLSSPVNLTGYSSAMLTLWRYVPSDIYVTEDFKVELYDGSRWNTAHHWSGREGNDGKWRLVASDLEEYLDVPEFKVRFVADRSWANRPIQVDNLIIVGVPHLDNQNN